MGKKDKKKKKRKSTKEEKAQCSSSNSSSEAEDVWVEKGTAESAANSKPFPPTDPFDQLFSTHATSKDELKQKKQSREQSVNEFNANKRSTTDSELESTITSRELNPYWKNGGKGLPSNITEVDRKVEDVSEDTGDCSSNYGVNLKKSWNQNSFSKAPKVHAEPGREDHNTLPRAGFDLNKLSAELLRAELMGDNSKVEELKLKIDAAKKSAASNDQVLLTKIGPSGVAYPVNRNSDQNFGANKRRGKIVTHDEDGKRVRYSADDDNQSVQDLLIKERSQSASNQNAALLKFMGGNGRGFETLDDMFVSAKAQKKSSNVEEKFLEDSAKREHRKALQTIEDCYLCFNSARCQQRLVVNSKEYSYISIPYDTPLVKNHCLICPVLHYSCSTLLDEEVFEEIESQKRFLVERFAMIKKRCVFVECFRGSRKCFHMFIECIPIGRSAFSEAPMFFKKAIMESEEEWSMNKKLVDLKNNDVRRTIPKGLSYFTVQFGLDPGGFAHVIEDSSLFPKHFARQVIGGIVDLDDFVVQRPKALSREEQESNVKKFKKDVLGCS